MLHFSLRSFLLEVGLRLDTGLCLEVDLDMEACFLAEVEDRLAFP